MLTKNALTVLKKRYLLRDKNGKLIETPNQLFKRVAKAISKGNKKLEKEFFNAMYNLEFLPNSPTLMNAGTSLGQLSACFVLSIEDSLTSIFDTVKNAALIHQSGGGTGFNFSKLRPKNSLVQSTHGVASGPVSFMTVIDKATEVIKQGGKRRGANMGILNIDHPDIIEFITAKNKPILNNFNISVAITDKFMEAVKKNKKYDLIDSKTKKIKKESARKIFNLIAYNAWKNGDPGLIFIDEINRHNPTPKLGRIEATNPCLSGDTWILTKNGSCQIKDVINKDILLAVNGNFFESKGFFPTGKKEILKISTKEGYEIKATGNHLFLAAEKITRYTIKKKWKTIMELKKGDILVLGNNRGVKWEGNGSFEEGYLLGLLVGDGELSEKDGIISVWKKDKGSFSMVPEIERIAKKILEYRKDFRGFQKEDRQGRRRIRLKALKDLAFKFGLTSKNKRVTSEIEKASYEFYQGFFRGFFDTDGSVQGSQKKGVSIRLWQNNLKNLKSIQRMLQRIGIASSIYKRKGKERKLMPDGKGGKRYYITKRGYELIISGDNILIFAEEIGLLHDKKQKKLLQLLKSYKRKLNRERFIVKIKKIEKIGRENVFDINVPGINKFDANCFIVHNCGEVPLLPYESCILGSINLNKVVNNGEIDFEKLEKLVRTGVKFLNNVIDINKYPLKEIEKITKKNRKIGLGVMGFANILIKLKISYDSEEAIKTVEKIMKFISEKAKKYSKNNKTLTTIAPTGTISLIADCSSGIEPLFAIAYIKEVLSGEKLLITNKEFEKIAKERGFYSKKLMEEIAKKGSLKDIKEIPKDIKKLFVTAMDIKPEWHLKIQAAFQKYTDNAVSKTINLPNKATVNDVKQIFLLAYKLKCKGITIYRYGSKPKQVLYVDVGECLKGICS